MLIKRIEGFGRTLGKSQGYRELHIRDVRFPSGEFGMQSAWEPTPAEIEAIAAGAPIILTVMGSGHPPVKLEVGEVPSMSETTEEKVRKLIGDQLGWNEAVMRSDDATALCDLAFDPLDYLELSIEIEDAFRIDCRDDEIRAALDVAGVIRLVKGKLFGDGLHGEGTA